MSSAKPIVVLHPARTVHTNHVDAVNPQISVPAQSMDYRQSRKIIASINPVVVLPPLKYVAPRKASEVNLADASAVGSKRVTQDSLTEPFGRCARLTSNSN